ncbi:hypothetical protein [Xylanimonas allomyrinae]|uniref:hypothetical protein n=1 Tax=Xylanimonas allomyrinae TaxID=2509459 RepID=UPI0013A64974|nr:hypothetical protein [Xylanimonas allomyrinae]
MRRLHAATTIMLLTTALVTNDYGGVADDENDNVIVESSDSAWTSAPDGGREPNPSTPPPVKYLRANDMYCAVTDLDPMVTWAEYFQGSCPDGSVNLAATLTCPPDTYQLDPLWVQHLQPDGTYTTPQPVTGTQCITPADLTTQARNAFTTMHIPTPTATLQTATPTLLLNTWYPAYTTPTPTTQHTTLLDVPVEIRALPTHYTWDFDDPFSPTGPTLTTTDPGHPWTPGDPDVDHHWTAHAWTRLGDPHTPTGHTAGTRTTPDGIHYRTDVTITLTTTWHGQYRITGTPTWTDIPDTLTTTSTAGTYTLTEAHTRLYCDTLDGHTTC